ncbi:hypothetical protein Fcan01_25980 [Folsomia candida]|uniref:Uncharacterized protein n=1 Tax=Folsomia candida TaxID=158441 RepID=A0A226D1D0_FOLCA|nr:hypothetical protein Fcan01_25980 [Folsomia candida]
MNTPALLKCLKAYAEIYDRIIPIPISWNIKKTRFDYRLKHGQLLVWYFQLSVTFFTACFCAYICIQSVFVKDSHIPVYVSIDELFFFLVIGVLGFCGGLVTIFYGPVVCSAWDNFRVLEKFLTSGTVRRPYRNVYFDDFFNVLAVIIAYVSIIAVLIGSITMIIVELDPFYFVLRNILDDNALLRNWGKITVMRYTIMWISLYETSRIALLALIICTTFALILITLVDVLSNSKLTLVMSFKIHNIAHLVLLL